MIYDSKALTLPQWDNQRDQLISDGWEYRGEVKNGVVYLRRYVSGETNTDDNKWLSDKIVVDKIAV